MNLKYLDFVLDVVQVRNWWRSGKFVYQNPKWSKVLAQRMYEMAHNNNLKKKRKVKWKCKAYKIQGKQRPSYGVLIKTSCNICLISLVRYWYHKRYRKWSLSDLFVNQFFLSGLICRQQSRLWMGWRRRPHESPR